MKTTTAATTTTSLFRITILTNLRVFVAWGCQFRATHQNVNHLQSDQEEADTKMLLPALDAT